MGRLQRSALKNIFGQKLKAWRESKTDYSQGELGARVGMTQDQISHIERGTYPDIYLSTALRLAGALECTLDDILMFEPEPGKARR